MRPVGYKAVSSLAQAFAVACFFKPYSYFRRTVKCKVINNNLAYKSIIDVFFTDCKAYSFAYGAVELNDIGESVVGYFARYRRIRFIVVPPEFIVFLIGAKLSVRRFVSLRYLA